MTLSKNISGTLLTQILTNFLGIIAGIFITRMLGAEGRGVYVVFTTLTAVLVVVFNFSIEGSLIYFVASKKIEEKQLKGIAFYILLIGMVLIILFTLFFYFYNPGLIYADSKVSFYYIIWLWLCSFFCMLNSIYSGFFEGILRYDISNKINIYNSIQNLFFYGFLFFLSISDLYSIHIKDILMITLFVFILNTLHWHFYFFRQFNYDFTLKLSYKEDIKKFIDFAGISHFSSIINFLNNRLTIWIIAFYLDNYTIGIYSIATGITQLFSVISVPISNVLMPYLTKSSEADKIDIFCRYSRINFSLFFILSFFGSIILSKLIPLVYGAEFENSVLPFLILSLGVPFLNQLRIFSAFLLSINKIKYSLYSTILGFIIMFFFTPLLISKFNIIGASVASVLISITTFCYLYFICSGFIKQTKANILFVTKKDISEMKSFTHQIYQKYKKI